MREGWEMRKLKEVSKTGAGGTPKKSFREYYEGGKIPWLQSGAVAQGEIHDSNTFITELGLKNSSAKLFPKDTVLVAMYGATAGQVGILRFEACTNQAVCGILPSKDLIPEYTFYYFLSQKSNLLAQAVGNAQPNISQAKIKETPIPVPPLAVQRRIVSRLDAAFGLLDSAQVNVERNHSNLADLWQSLLTSLFSSKVPKAKKVKLSDIIEVKHGFAFKSEFFQFDGQFELLTPGNFHEIGGYRYRGKKQRFYVGDFPEDYILKKGDLLVAMTEQAAGLLGSSMLIPGDDMYLHNQRLGLITVKDNSISNEYLYHLFNTPVVRKALHHSGTGLKVRHTSPKKIGEVEVYVSYDEDYRKHVVHTLDQVYKYQSYVSQHIKTRLEQLNDLRSSLLEGAFSGDWVN